MIEKLLSKLTRISGINIEYYIKNGKWTTGKQIIELLFGMALTVIFARYASKELYGNFQYVLSIVSILSIFSIPGLNTSVLANATKSIDGDYQKAVKKSLKFSLIGSACLLGLSLYYFTIKNNSLALAFLVLTPTFPIFISTNTWESLAMGKEKFKTYATFSSLKIIINSILVALGIALFNKLPHIIALYSITLAGVNVIAYIFSKKLVTNPEKKGDTIKYGWFITKLNALNIITSHIDKIIVNFLLGPAELAVYALGSNLAKKFYQVIKNALAVTTPKIAKIKKLKIKTLAGIFLISSICTIGLVFLLPHIVTILYTNKYSGSIPIAQIIISFIPFYILAILMKNHVIFSEKNKKTLIIEAISIPLLKVLIMIALTSKYQLNGLATAIGVQHVIGVLLLLTIRQVKRKDENLENYPKKLS